MELYKMDKKSLTPREIVNIKGKLLYNESKQAWSNIRLKRELINEFPQLKEKRSQFSYEMLICKSNEEIERKTKELAKKGERSEEHTSELQSHSFIS